MFGMRPREVCSAKGSMFGMKPKEVCSVGGSFHLCIRLYPSCLHIRHGFSLYVRLCLFGKKLGNTLPPKGCRTFMFGSLWLFFPQFLPTNQINSSPSRLFSISTAFPFQCFSRLHFYCYQRFSTALAFLNLHESPIDCSTSNSNSNSGLPLFPSSLISLACLSPSCSIGLLL